MKILQKFTLFLLLAAFLSFSQQAHSQSNTPLPNLPTFNGAVRAITVSGGVVYVGGEFTQATDAPANGGATVTRNRLAAIDAATGALLPWNPHANNSVYTIAVSGTTVYVGGIFSGANSINGTLTRNYIAALDAVTGTATAWDPNANFQVFDIAVSGGTVYAAGVFTNIGGQARNRIAALDAITGAATAWNPNANNSVLSLVVSGSSVYAGGYFTSIGGQSRNYVAELDAATGGATAWDPNVGNLVFKIAKSGTTIYVGGLFTNVDGQPRSRIAALDATMNTNNLTAWDPSANNSVTAFAVSGNTVYAGGLFSTISGQARNGIAALDATMNTNNVTAWNPNPDVIVTSIAVSGSTLYLGGLFSNIGGVARQGFAAFSLITPTAAYTGTVFTEAAANDGSITVTQDVTLANDTWLPAGAFTGGGMHFTATGVPAGLTLIINRISPTVARISFTGNAAAHTAANNTTVTLNFANAAVASGNAAGVAGLSPKMLTINFDNPLPLPVTPSPPPAVAPTISGGAFSGSVGLPFGASLNLNGNPIPSVSVSAGSLPPGVALMGGNLTGIPSQQGVFSFTLTATNSAGTAKADMIVNVGPAVPLITGIVPPSGTFGSKVTILGYNLTGANAVSIGGVAVQDFTIEGGNIVAVVGAGGTGSVSVSTPLGSVSGGSFIFEIPNPPVLLRSTLPTITTGDENAPIFIAGLNIPVYASVSMMPITSDGRATGASVPLQITASSSTGATVLVPAAARLVGTKQVQVRVVDKVVSATFAVVYAPPPLVRELSIASTTASGEAFTTVVNGSGFFRHGLARVFLGDDESFYSNVVESTQVRVHIPAALNVRNGSVKIRIQNLDGQHTEATVRIIGLNAPLITSVTPRWVQGNLTFIVRGVAFSVRPFVVLNTRQLTVLRASDTELEVAVPKDYPAPTFGTALLLVENPDGQRYGFLVGAPLFMPPSSLMTEQKTSSKITSSINNKNTIVQANKDNVAENLRLSPNPASEILTLNVPNFKGEARLQIVNMRGEVMISGMVSGRENVSIPLHSMATGAYFIRILSEEMNIVARFTIIR